MSILKRQRELRKAEKAARKRARRHGLREEGSLEPSPSVAAAELLGLKPPADEGALDSLQEEHTEQARPETD